MGNIFCYLFRVRRSTATGQMEPTTTPNVAERLPRGACAQYIGVNLIRVGGACLTHLLLPQKVSTPVVPSTRNIGGWAWEFTEESTRVLIRRLTVASPEKVREMAERGGALHNLASRQMLEYGIESGRGGVTLKLTAEQLARLKPVGSVGRMQPIETIFTAIDRVCAKGVGVDRLRRAVGTFRNVIVARWVCKLLKMWWPETGSNRRRRPFQGRALPLSYLALA
jgi:hypothetical protein